MENHSFTAVLGITENRSRIFAFIVALVRDFDTAEDLFQETVVQILKSEHQFDPTRNFLPWACGIARNVVRQYWKRRAKSPSTGIEETLHNLATIATDENAESWARERKVLRSCLQKLPEKMQRLLMLRYGHNIKGKELADSTPINPGSIRTTLARLRTQLRQCIQAKTANE